jgi:Ca2+-binding RTX toxin-like protein
MTTRNDLLGDDLTMAYIRDIWPQPTDPNYDNNTPVGGTDGADRGAIAFTGVASVALGKGDDVYTIQVEQQAIEKSDEGIDTISLSMPWVDGNKVILPTVYSLPDNIEILSTSNAGSRPFDLMGNDADNRITGSSFGDVINGEAGRDLLTGSTGADVFVVQAGNGSDTITDFDYHNPYYYYYDDYYGNYKYDRGDSESDTVRLEGYGFRDFAAVKAAMTELAVKDPVQDPVNDFAPITTYDVRLDLGNGETLTFRDHRLTDFTANNFELSSAHPDGPIPFDLPGSEASSGSQLYGSEGYDTLYGSERNDYLNGWGGVDLMMGGVGDDTYVVDSKYGDDIIEQRGCGIDTVISAASRWTLAPNVENLEQRGTYTSWMTGNELDNRLTGNEARNFMRGEGGHDILEGGGGADDLTGGTDSDMFVFRSLADAGDIIRDFELGTDLIDLRPMLIHLPEASVTLSENAAGTAVTVDGIALVSLAGVTPEALGLGTDVLLS